MDSCNHSAGVLLIDGFPAFVIGRCEGCTKDIMYTNVMMTRFDNRIEVQPTAHFTIALQKTSGTIIYEQPTEEV